MDSHKLNYYIGAGGIPIGLLLMLAQRDLGATVFLIGAINYALYQRNSGWTVI